VTSGIPIASDTLFSPIVRTFPVTLNGLPLTTLHYGSCALRERFPLQSQAAWRAGQTARRRAVASRDWSTTTSTRERSRHSSPTTPLPPPLLLAVAAMVLCASALSGRRDVSLLFSLGGGPGARVLIGLFATSKARRTNDGHLTSARTRLADRDATHRALYMRGCWLLTQRGLAACKLAADTGVSLIQLDTGLRLAGMWNSGSHPRRAAHGAALVASPNSTHHNRASSRRFWCSPSRSAKWWLAPAGGVGYRA